MNPLGQVPSGKVIDRSRYDEELRDSAVKRHLFALTKAEVGGQGKEAQQALMETIYNRAQYRNTTLLKQMQKNYYEPMRNNRFNEALSSLSEKEIAEYEVIMKKVQDGSNITSMALHNGSAGIATKAQRTFAAGKEIGREYFGIKGGAPGDPDERDVAARLRYRSIV